MLKKIYMKSQAGKNLQGFFFILFLLHPKYISVESSVYESINQSDKLVKKNSSFLAKAKHKKIHTQL